MKTVKKALTAFLAVFVIFTTFPLTAHASEIAISNIEGESLSDNGTTVTAKPVPNFGTLNFSPAIAGRITDFIVNVNIILAGQAGDTVSGTIKLESNQLKNLRGRYDFVNSYCTHDSGAVNNGEFTFTATLNQNCDNVVLPISIKIMYFNVVDGQHDVDLSVRVSASVERESENAGLLKKVLEWLQSIFDNLKEIPDKIGNFFNDLKNNLSTWFANIGNWFTELGDKISSFFIDIGDKISGFFEKLWNRIYWGNENGESEYEPPTFGEKFTEFLQKLEEYVNQLQQVHGNISDSKDEAVSYLSQGTTLINSVMGVFPSVLTAFVSFGLAFIFCRKVVGR